MNARILLVRARSFPPATDKTRPTQGYKTLRSLPTTNNKTRQGNMDKVCTHPRVPEHAHLARALVLDRDADREGRLALLLCVLE